ncbi:hypothetical protein BDY17DRAFT_289882 [Neohortaea acidophila]|uniref:Core domain-containing protein n=1 Tax=Neohortaea acidophila TaxID=245834 RepID=A0A6A6Q728_9PEZI|nr:uncharacterized protein BDY17DRAFT_289882 [Neohortaea acidophila]KAF2487881.1 hypothetical protein BDY17DRAFT_289882 [Neohortaea acidophila]
MATKAGVGACARYVSSRAAIASRRPCPTAAASTRLLHTPATPLYLDFLAPSWQTPTTSKHGGYTPAPHRIQSRPLSSTSRRAATAITNPRKDSSGNEMSITITPRAAHRLQTISETDQNPNLALRVSVESGGCHGFQYLMSLVSTADIDAEEDTVFENEEVARKTGGEYKAKVVMDEPSLELLTGSNIDYTMELIGSQFKVTGIPGATSSCGCGTSFDIAT